jgi:hypothetical protein
MQPTDDDKDDDCDLKHILAKNKSYLGPRQGTRWWESTGELREFHLG